MLQGYSRKKRLNKSDGAGGNGGMEQTVRVRGFHFTCPVFSNFRARLLPTFHFSFSPPPPHISTFVFHSFRFVLQCLTVSFSHTHIHPAANRGWPTLERKQLSLVNITPPRCPLKGHPADHPLPVLLVLLHWVFVWEQSHIIWLWWWRFIELLLTGLTGSQ